MKKTEQQRADELDAFLTAVLPGGQVPSGMDLLPEEETLAAALVQLAEAEKPDAAFVEQLERQVAAKAAVSRRPKGVGSPERRSFWRQILENVKEGFTMKRTVYAFGVVAAIAIVAVVGWTMFGRDGAAPDSVAVVPAENGGDTAVDSPVDVADLPKLPALSGTSGPAYGLGGGGGAESAAVGAPLAADQMIMPAFTDIFSGTVFTLNATLPTEPVTALVQQQTNFTIDEARAAQLAASFGFAGPLYVQHYRPYPASLGVDAGVSPDDLPPIYYAFDGSRVLTIDGHGVYYRDDSVEFDFENPMSFEQAAPIAEAFLQARGLLNFPYVMEAGWGSDVFFKREIEGRVLNQPEVIVTVNQDGSVPFMSYSVLSNLEVLGTYPLRSAEEAWNLILDGVQKNNVFFNWLPVDVVEDTAVSLPVEPIGEYQYWQRTHAPGQEVHLYSWPSIYLPVSGEGLPRIDMYPYRLAGDEALLQEIVNSEETMLHVWGTISEDGEFLNVAGWEQMLEPQSLFLEGIIRRDGDQVLLLTTDRQTYILPDAPAEVADNLSVFIFGWATRDVGAAYPVLDWESIEQRTEPVTPEEGEALPEPMPMPIEEPGFFTPPTFATFAVDSVSMIYHYMPIYPEYEEGVVDTRLSYGPPPVVLMPVWRFTGTADTGERLELLVSAVAPEFLETP